MENIPFIHIENLSYSYVGEDEKPIPVLKDLSLNISEGEYVVILGHNGSGKSTFAKLLNMVIDLAGLEIIAEVVSKAGLWAPVVSCVVGMIPNCASSVAITQLYLSGAISLGTAMAGLLTGSGIAWIVLFRVNPHSRQNFKIMGIVFIVGAVSGIVMNMLGVAI